MHLQRRLDSFETATIAVHGVISKVTSSLSVTVRNHSLLGVFESWLFCKHVANPAPRSSNDFRVQPVTKQLQRGRNNVP